MVKWERYTYLNNIYSKIYNYEKNISPAPSPHYLLDKFSGNLTINEYRKVLNSNRLLMIINKPMTKIFPELFEEINDIPNIENNLIQHKNKKSKKSNINFWKKK